MKFLKKVFSISTAALLTALILSGIAAWYSIIGLTAIFAAAVIPVIIMGASLELAKVVTTVWLHKHWKRAGFLMKAYLVPAVAVLALITSMGIFGFLSKAHLEQTTPTGDVAAQIQLIDEKITIRRETVEAEKKNIEVARTAIAQLDAQVTARMGILSSDDAAAGLRVRRQQKEERDSLAKEITTAQEKIEKLNAEIAILNEERLPITSQLRKVEAEVGPIKYIAALIYGDDIKDDVNALEKAVRWVIILLVLVFDPLALCLVIAALASYKYEYPEVETVVTIKNPEPKVEPVKEEVVEEPLPEVIEEIVEEPAEEVKEEPQPLKKKLKNSLLNLSKKLKLKN